MYYLHFIAAPVLGALIGLITNGIAIRMLFRPFKPIYIGKYKLPFTPGLIPKEKSRIAKAIGQVIGANLLDAQTLSNALASEKIKSVFEQKIDDIIDNLRAEERTVQQYIEKAGFEETVDQAVAYAGNHFGVYVAEKLVENQVGTEIFEFALTQLVQNLNPMFVMVAESAIESSRNSILDKIDEMILTQCPSVIDGYLEKEYGNLMEKPMNEFATTLWKQKEMIKEKVWGFYLIILEKKSGSFIQNLDVASIVEEKIQDFDEQELERLILDIAKKELDSLVWIGGLLGMLIGFANLLF